MERSIALLQELLARLGYLTASFEPRQLDGPTRAAMREFQRLHGLAAVEEPDAPTWDALATADERGECVIAGQVLAGDVPLERAVVAVQDRELGDPSAWPHLGRASTDRDGRFVIIYAAEQVLPGDRPAGRRTAVADLIFSVAEAPVRFEGFDLYRLPEDVQVPGDERELGIQARRLERVRIALRHPRRIWREGESEYERVLAAFREVWPEVSPGSLDDARHEPAFVSRELGVPREEIDALTGAFRMSRGVFDGAVPEPILYALARSGERLVDLPRLATATPSGLRRAIVSGIERLVIPPQPDDVVARSIDVIGERAPRAVLGDERSGYGRVLAGALPDRAQQVALLRAAGAHAGDPRSMWDALRAEPAFAAPDAVERAQFALQLDALTQRHVPLLSAIQREPGVTSMRSLLDLGAGGLKAIVSRPDVGVPPGTPGDTPEARVDAYVTGVMGQLQHAFPTETVARSIAAAPADALGGDAAKRGAAALLARATSGEMRAAGAAFDIRTTRIEPYVEAHPEVLADVAEADRRAAVHALKRSQRLYGISTGPASFEWLLKSRHGSAYDIAQTPRQTFVRSASGELGTNQAAMMHYRAVTSTAAALTTYVHVRDLLTGVFPAAITSGRDWVEQLGPIKDAVVKYLPTWSELFGETSFCECTHCRSVYSPAAYLVDLLNMLDHSGRNAANETPLDVLLARRPDLAALKLTCENTNTVIPYVDLVNEVLESLVVSNDLKAIPAFDTGSAASHELKAAPQHTNWDAYATPAAPGSAARLDRAVYPAPLPFDAPLAAARAYLQPFRVTRADLMAVFAAGPMTDARAAEILGIAPGTFAAITGSAIDGTPSPLAAGVDDRFGWSLEAQPDLATGAAGPLVWALKRKLNTAGAGLTVGDGPAAESFGPDTEAAVKAFQTGRGLPSTGSVDADTWKALLPLDPSIGSAFLAHVPTLLARAGLTYAALLDLLALRIVNPERRTFEVIGALRLPGADVLTFAAGGFTAPGAALAAALAAAGVPEDDFAAWARERLDGEPLQRLRRTIVADGPQDQPCDLDAVRLVHWDSASPAIDDAEWLKLDSVLRLWRGLGWELQDLDLALSALGATDITPEVMRGLAQIRTAERLLGVEIAEVVALWADLDPARSGSVYARRFRSRAVLRRDPAFEPDWAGRVPPGAKVVDHLPALQAALRCSGPDMEALRAALAIGDADTLDAALLSRLFRHVTLAKALGLNVRDLLRMTALTGLDPFKAPSDEWPLLDFAGAVRRLHASNVNAAQLSFAMADVTKAPADAARDRLLAALGDGLRAIAADLDEAAETTDGALTRRALTLLDVEPTLVDKAMQDVLGTERVTAVLSRPASPPPAIPAEWAERLRYTPAEPEPSLSALGTLTDAEQLVVRGFSTDAEYREAVHRVWAEPRETLQKLSDALAAVGVTLTNPSQIVGESLFVAGPEKREAVVRARLLRVLQDVLPPLRLRLKRSLVRQALAAIGFDAATLALLLEERTALGEPVLPAHDATKPIVEDFLALEAAGGLANAVAAFELLARFRLLTAGLGLSADDVAVIARALVSLRSSPSQLCTFDEWTTMATYAALRARPGVNRDRFASLWAQTSDDGVRAAIHEVFGWPEETIAALTAPDGLSFGSANLYDLARLERLVAAGALVDAMGVTVAEAAAWARAPIDAAAADAIQRAARAGYDEEGWLAIAKTANDTLREARRAALVAYVAPRLGVRDASGLYERLLIDVETGPSVGTSRIKQAISSVQLFVQRALLNLEPGVPPDAVDAGHWKWIQNYRVWEANRKVLLYPENWIEPELRDDRTPFFKELESDLLQDDVTDASVERALLTYLDKLDDVAKLDIAGLCVQDSFAPDEKLQTVVHLFGRTANPPQAYYYRRYVVTDTATSYWTPWERVPVDIQGSLIAPVVHHRRLYVFWASIGTKPKDVPMKASAPTLPEYYQEIALSWSEYRNGAWSPKRTTVPHQLLREDVPDTDPAAVTVQGIERRPPLDVVERLEARVERGVLRVLCVASRSIIWTDEEKNLSYSSAFVLDEFGNLTEPEGNQAYTYALGSFVLDTCHGELVADPKMIQDYATSGVVLRVRGGALEAKPLASKPLPGETVLGAVHAGTRLAEQTWIHQGSGYAVVSDGDRSYFGHITTVVRPGHDLLERPYLALPHDIGLLEVKPRVSETPAAYGSVLQHVASTAALAADSWASASASFATVALSAKAKASGPPIVSGLQDAVFVEASRIHEVGKYLVAAADVATVTFEPLFHPFVCTYVERVEQFGVDGLLTLANQRLVLSPSFEAKYKPNPSAVAKPYPADVVDFGATGKPGIFRTTAYSAYNWELFFHIPMMVASRLRQNQRFAEAQRWLHYVFNPTDGQGSYWKLLPFVETPAQSIEAWLQQLQAGDPDLQAQIAEWKDHPFEPHRIARMRLTSYMKYVVMQYVENLIEWADHQFARDTLESINLATLLYVTAASLLGKGIVAMRPRGEPAPMTFAQMRGKLDALGNVIAEFQNTFPHLSSAAVAPSQSTAGLLGISKSLYFCVPPNEKLLAYWDTVADRLFKIRNSMNIAGVVRELPLFEPPIDPALLVRAAAQGVDISAVLQDLDAPVPFYRFTHVLRQALEACDDVKALGAALLSALEKKDAEELALMRAAHETAAQETALEAARQREAEAGEQVAALERARAAPVARLLHFRGLMGADDLSVPEIGAEVPNVAYNPKPAAEGGVFLIEEERQALAASHSARDWQVRSSTMETLASLMYYIPDVTIVTAPLGAGTQLELGFGGKHLGPALTAIAKYQATLGARDAYDASQAAKMGEFKRRQQTYAHEANMAGREIMQVDRQITAAQIRATIARLEREQLELRISQAKTIDEHLKHKYTSQQLYGWMQGQISRVYFQAYQLAYERARRAERAFRFERGLTSSQYVRFGAWDSLRKGLLAGEQLHLQLRQLERAYDDQHRRDLELTRHVSLLQIAPMALVQLKETGRCEVELPEWLYDMDHPGHYMRRIKSVSVSIPAVAGPYTPVNAALTMLSNETRVNGALKNGRYEKNLEGEDDRFVSDFTAIQAIATSTGREDAGMFELSFRDERYLPFEGAGAVSRWRLTLDPDCNRFDVQSVSDVVLHIRYTARDGGAILAQKAKERWKKLVADQENAPLSRLFSLKHEFTSEWRRLLTAADENGDHAQTFSLARDRFPCLFRRARLSITGLDVVGVPGAAGTPTKLPTLWTPKPDEAAVNLEAAAPIDGVLHMAGQVDVGVADEGEQAAWLLSVRRNDVAASLELLDDLLLVCHYTVKPLT